MPSLEQTCRDLDVLIVGAGAFGCAAALALAERLPRVALLDPGPVPHPRAASTDISKLVRPDYGADDTYTDLALAALACWNTIRTDEGSRLLHLDGFAVLSSTPPRPGTFEHDSLRSLRARAVPVLPLTERRVRERLPAWNARRYAAGHLHHAGGWVPSARAISHWHRGAIEHGVLPLLGSPATDWILDGHVVRGVRTADGACVEARHTVLAAGAWSPALLSKLASHCDRSDLAAPLHPVAQPLFHLAPADPDRYRPPAFLPWAADIAHTGWYGFPANEQGIVKIGNHGPGIPCPPDADPGPIEPWIERLRAFLAEAIPALAAAPVVETRWCWYCDSSGGDFVIDGVPGLEGITLASGGSGHAFKFLPLLGARIAAAVLDEPDPVRERFRWPDAARTERREAARRLPGTTD